MEELPINERINEQKKIETSKYHRKYNFSSYKTIFPSFYFHSELSISLQFSLQCFL